MILIALAFYWHWAHEGKRYAPGVLIQSSPVQVNLNNAESWNFKSKNKEYRITPKAQYSFSARVLSVNRAYGDAAIGPEDIVIGWGAMSDQKVLDQLKISQDNMRYWYVSPRGGDWPIPMDEVALHAVNTHLIPANPVVEQTVKSARKGDLIQAKGYLVDVSRADGFFWNTSVGPSGFGDHSCKIIWLEELKIL